MKKILNVPVLAIFGIALIFTACDEVNDPVVEYPSLKLVSETREISYVKFVGYEFGTLKIEPGSSQTFILDKGMSGGYEDINVIVGYKRFPTVGGSLSTTVNFYKGEITTITLKGCTAEGCSGIYLE